MKYTPPKFFVLLLRWFCNVEFLEEVEGDLQEQFSAKVQSHGLWRARVDYVRDVVHALRVYPVKRHAVSETQSHRISFKDALSHFLKLTFRNMVRSKTTTFINVIGLAFSLTSFLMIALYLVDEVTFDQHHPNSKNIFRIGHSYNRYGDGAEETDARAAGLWVVAMKESMPEIKSFTRFSRFGYPGKVRLDNTNAVFTEQQFFWADSTFSNIFKVDMLKGGTPEQILRNPNQVIITEEIATKYFGKEDPIGKSLTYSRQGVDMPIAVAGVMKRFPTNSHFHPDFIASNLTLNPLWKETGEERIASWRDAFTYSYLEVEEGVTESAIAAGLQKVFDTHLNNLENKIWPSVIRMTDIHFTPGREIELEATGDKNVLYIFGSVALLILLIASINYMNLATARSFRRSKEVGLRKTLGSGRSSLIVQFLGESFLITAISLIAALLLLALLLPVFNEITEKRFVFNKLFEGDILLLLFAVLFVIGFLSGIYPAFYLSSFNPLKVLKGKSAVGKSAENFRRVLVVFQFAITLFLIAGTIVIDQQLKLIQKSKLSEYENQIVAVRLTVLSSFQQADAISTELARHRDVTDIALATHIPRRDHFGWIDSRFKTLSSGETEYVWQVLDGSPNFPSLFNLELVAGRTFINKFGADSTNVLINETAAADLHLNPSQAVGVQLEDTFTKKKRTIIGVVRDFHYTSVKRKISPLVINCNPASSENMYIKLSGTDYARTLTELEAMWKKIVPLAPFEYSFLNEQFASLYRGERQTNLIVRYFSVLAIIIGCLGLFGLASFIAEQKTKEIGIRKVLGASSVQILTLLTSRFVKLVMLSFIFGVPLAYYFINLWLETFVYHIEVNALFFVIPAVLIVALTLITVGIESLRASLANPVDSIRNE
jgi:putative ABC transport system permease protein